MRIIIILFIITSLKSSAYAQDSLASYLQHAYEHQPSLKAAYTKFEMALQRIPQAKAMPDPKLSFGYFISPVETRLGPQQAKFSLSQQLPWFGTLKAKGEAAALAAEVLHQDFLTVKNRLTYQIKMAYYPLYEIQAQLKWEEANLKLLEYDKALATTTFSSGKGALTDALRVDLMISDSQTEIQLLQAQYQALAKAFNHLLNRDEHLPVSVPSDLTISGVGEDFEKDSLATKHPSLIALDKQVKAAQGLEKVAQKNALPQVALGLDYAFVGNRTDANPEGNGRNILMPRITVSLPLAKAKYQAAIKEQALKQEFCATKKEAMTNELTANYESTQYQLQEAIAKHQLYNQQITKTKQIIELLQTSYSNSGKDFEDILSMQQQLLNYQIAKVATIKNYYLALAKLAYLLGQG